MFLIKVEQEDSMYVKTSSVEAILLEKQKVTVGRDSLSDLLRYMKNELKHFELIPVRNSDEPLKKKITNYKNIMELISQSIKATYDILKPVKGRDDYDIFSEVARLLIENVKMIKALLKENANDIIYRFKGIIKSCNDIIGSADRLKTLVAI